MNGLGPLLHEEPAIPERQTVCWVDASLLPPGDPEAYRPVVVLAAPARTTGTVTVVARSGVDRFGVEHGPDPELGLSTPGRFSRRHAVQCQLWSPGNVTTMGALDDATFTAVLDRFGP